MKKFAMILKALVIVVITISSIAFNKISGLGYCVKTGPSGTCTIFLTNQRADPSGTLYRGYASHNPLCPQRCWQEVRLLDQE